MCAHFLLEVLLLRIAFQLVVFLEMNHFTRVGCFSGSLLHACVSDYSLSNTTMLFCTHLRLWSSLCTSFFLKTVRDINGLPPKVLTFHLLNRIIGTLKIIKANEAILLGLASLRIPHNFGTNNNAKLREDIFKCFFIDSLRQIADKNISSDLLRALVLARLVYLQCFIEHFD